MNNETRAVTVRLPVDLLAKIKEMAKSQRRNLTNMVTILLENSVKEKPRYPISGRAE